MSKRARTVTRRSGGNKFIRGWYEESAQALLRKGDRRLWTNVFVRERQLPFLKPRPTDAFRTILFCYVVYSLPSQTTAPCSLIPTYRKDLKPDSCGMVLHVFYGNLQGAYQGVPGCTPRQTTSACREAICRCSIAGTYQWS